MKPMDDERDAIEAAAAEWLARRDRRFTAEEAVAFARWRQADPRHRAAVAELETTWTALDGLAAQAGQPGTDAAALPAPPALAAGYLPDLRADGRATAWWPWLAVAAAVAMVAGGLWWRGAGTRSEASLRYETLVGMQRTIGLSDGSELRLNTDTAVVVQFDRTRRGLLLERGEAYFQVAPEPARPFIVMVRGVEARAVGTAFAVRVRERAGEVELIVTEGRVSFGRAAEPAPTLERGQRGLLAWTRAEAARITTLDEDALARRLAWQAGRVEFKNTPLAEAVAELNRYQRRQVVLQDDAIGRLPLGGGFKIGNVENFVRIIESAGLGVIVLQQDEERIVLGSRL